MITKGHYYYLTKYVFSYLLMSNNCHYFSLKGTAYRLMQLEELSLISGRSKIMSFKIFKNKRTWTLLVLVIRLYFAINKWHKRPGSCQRTWPVPVCCDLVLQKCMVKLHNASLVFANAPVLTTVSQQNPIWSSECFL